MAKRKRRNHSNEKKAEILRRHMVDKVPVSDLCDEYKISPSVFYGWQQQLMQNLDVALEATSGTRSRRAATRESQLARENETLRAKLVKKDHVIAEISEEYVTLKKELGEP
jgi:transposase-like protein